MFNNYRVYPNINVNTDNTDNTDNIDNIDNIDNTDNIDNENDDNFVVNTVKMSPKKRSPINLKIINNIEKNKLRNITSSNVDNIDNVDNVDNVEIENIGNDETNKIITDKTNVENVKMLNFNDILECENDNCPIEFKKVLKLPEKNYINKHIEHFISEYINYIEPINSTNTDINICIKNMISKQPELYIIDRLVGDYNLRQLVNNILLIYFGMIPQYYMRAISSTLNTFITV